MIKKIIRQSELILKYIFRAFPWNFHKFPLINKFKNKKAYVLVNGPSLKKALEDFDNGLNKFDSNSFFVNLSPLDPHFFQIKPKHFCVSDPMFYQDYLPKMDQIRKMYDLLDNNVDWDLYLYMCFESDSEYDKLIKYSKIKNPKIHFIRMNRKHCSDLYPSLRHWLYKKGWFMPEDGTIANTAIYLALIEGYKEIELYGADHNMFLELGVNENNQLCSLDSHFYDQGKPKMKVFKNPTISEDRAFRVHEFLYVLYVMFYSHNLLRQFADYLGARIINCTPGSMIDSYERKTGC